VKIYSAYLMDMFKSLFYMSFIYMGLTLVMGIAYALETAAPTVEDWKILLEAVGGLKGAGTLGIVAFVAQAILLIARTTLGDFAGKWKLAIIAFVSVVGAVTGLMMEGMTLIMSLTHGTVLAAVQVLAAQVYIQIKKED
jgi:hypothetical protein